MKKFLAYGGSVLAVATGLALLYKSSSKIKYQNFRILEKQSLIFILKQVRSEYSQKFSVPLRLNRKKRRSTHRAGRDYKNLVKELKDQSKEYIQKALEEVLEKFKITEEVLSESYKQFEQDPEVKAVLSKLCCVETSKVPSGIVGKLDTILDVYISRIEELNETDANELNLYLKVLEDDIFDEFGFEPEEIEEALKRNQKDFGGLMKTINELNDELLSKTNQEIFY
jgi:hypothetical protein